MDLKADTILEHRPDNIRARCANETVPPYPYSSESHHPKHHPSGSLSGLPVFSSAGALAPTGPGTGVYPVSTIVSADPPLVSFPSVPIYNFSFTIPSSTGGPLSVTAIKPTEPTSTIILSTYTLPSTESLPIYSVTILSYHHTQEHSTKNHTSAIVGPTAYSGASFSAPTGGFGSSGSGPSSYSGVSTAPYLNSTAGPIFFSASSTPSFYSSGSYVYKSVPVSSNNGALPATSPAAAPNTTVTSLITLLLPTGASATGGLLSYSGSPPLYTNTSTATLPSLMSLGTAPISGTGGALPASSTGTATYNTTIIYSVLTETVEPTPSSYSSFGTASSGFAPSPSNSSFSYTFSTPSVSSNNGALPATSPPSSYPLQYSYTTPVFNTSTTNSTFATSAPGIPSYPVYTYTPTSSSSSSISTDTCTDDPHRATTTSSSSTPAPYSFITITKSMPSEYFYHHHHPPQKTHKVTRPARLAEKLY